MIRTNISLTIAVIASSVFGIAVQAHAGMMTLPPSHQGWFDADGAHFDFNINTFTGFFPLDSSEMQSTRSFFTFDVNQLSGAVSEATVSLQLEAFFGSDPTQTFDLFDVTALAANLHSSHDAGSGMGLSIFDDLGTGQLYGTATVAESDVGQHVEIPLSQQALADINEAVKQSNPFSVGLRVRSSSTPIGDSKGVRFSSGRDRGDHALQLAGAEVSPVPEPSSLLLLGLGMGILLMVFPSRRKHQSQAA